MYLVRKNDKALQWAIPVDVLMSEGIPREDSVGVGEYQSIHTQITSYGDTSVLVTKMRIGKPKLIV
jgi:hypothetical protein